MLYCISVLLVQALHIVPTVCRTQCALGSLSRILVFVFFLLPGGGGGILLAGHTRFSQVNQTAGTASPTKHATRPIPGGAQHPELKSKGDLMFVCMLSRLAVPT
jgi:hypothetical protein